MLGNSFFELAQHLAGADSFLRMVELLDTSLAPLTGSREIIVVELGAHQQLLAVHGHGAHAGKLRASLDEWPRGNAGDFWSHHGRGKLGFAISDIPVDAAVNYRGYLNSLLGKNWGSDLLGGQLFFSSFRSARLLAVRNDGFYQPGERDAFDVALLMARTALERIALSKYERKIRERVLMAKRDALLAIFSISTAGLVTPLNPGGVQCSDAWWNADDPDFLIKDEALRDFTKAMELGWKTPTSPQWVRLELDLGGGAMEMTLLPKARHEGIVMFNPPERTNAETVDSGVPMLTRRQCDIMKWIAEGKTSSDVATILGISPRTVEKHLEAVFQRLGVENRVGAVRRYLELKAG